MVNYIFPRLFLVLVTGLALPASAQSLSVGQNQKIAFLGDSITHFGVRHKSGYVKLVVKGFEANGISVKSIPAGVSGHKSDQMLARLDRDVLSKNPDWMLLSCGVNDVWHGPRGIAIDAYMKNIAQIIDTAQSKNVKVMILTSTMIREDPDNDLNKKLEPYNAFLRKLSKKKNCLLADLNADMRRSLAGVAPAIRKTGVALTTDGIHMNPLGDEMMAMGILRAFGMKESQIQKAKSAWRSMADVSNLSARSQVSIAEYEKLRDIAAREGKSIRNYINDNLSKIIQEALESGSRS